LRARSFIDYLKRIIPKTEAETYLYFKYIVLDHPVDFDYICSAEYVNYIKNLPSPTPPNNNIPPAPGVLPNLPFDVEDDKTEIEEKMEDEKLNEIAEKAAKEVETARKEKKEAKQKLQKQQKKLWKKEKIELQKEMVNILKEIKQQSSGAPMPAVPLIADAKLAKLQQEYADKENQISEKDEDLTTTENEILNELDTRKKERLKNEKSKSLQRQHELKVAETDVRNQEMNVVNSRGRLRKHSQTVKSNQDAVNAGKSEIAKKEEYIEQLKKDIDELYQKYNDQSPKSKKINTQMKVQKKSQIKAIEKDIKKDKQLLEQYEKQLESSQLGLVQEQEVERKLLEDWKKTKKVEEKIRKRKTSFFT
jgi:chromosome segregation ATPase